MLTSVKTKASIYSAWCLGTPPSLVAKILRLSMTTVIAEYVRLDNQKELYDSTQ